MPRSSRPFATPTATARPTRASISSRDWAPALPGFNGINDHVASGIRRGMDGFLYIAVGDKGIPRGVGRDGATIQLHGGGVIRVRTDGTGLEVVSTGERNPLSVALSATDEVFTYGNDDDSKKWPNSLTHHIVGGHYGYPYQFLTSPHRALPIMAGQVGGSGAQGICYNEDGLPAEYHGNLFFCDWGLQTVSRFEIKKSGGTFAVTRRTDLVSKGDVPDFRPFSLAVADDGQGLWLVDWAYNGWLADGPRTGRLYRLRYTGSNPAAPRRPANRPRYASRRSTTRRWRSGCNRSESSRARGRRSCRCLVERLKAREPETGRLHALWALDAIGGDDARRAIGSVLADPSPRVRLQAGAVGRHSRRPGCSCRSSPAPDRSRCGGPARSGDRRRAAGRPHGGARSLRGPGRRRCVCGLVGPPGDSPAERLEQAGTGRGLARRSPPRGGPAAHRRSLGGPRRRGPHRGPQPHDVGPREGPDRGQPRRSLSSLPRMVGSVGSGPTRWPASFRGKPPTGRPRE